MDVFAWDSDGITLDFSPPDNEPFAEFDPATSTFRPLKEVPPTSP